MSGAVDQAELIASLLRRIENLERAASVSFDADAALEALKAQCVTFVNHGSDATVARPSGFAMVIWKGTVDPDNADETDDLVFLPAP